MVKPTPAPTWSGSLRELLPTLTAELAGQREQWAHRLLRGGALVAVRIRREDDRRVLRIARPDRPGTPAALAKWAKEVEVFQEHLGCRQWQPVPAEEATGVAVAFLELYDGEIKPGRARCTGEGCTAEIPFNHVWGSKQLCDLCARLAGDRETQELQAKRSV